MANSSIDGLISGLDTTTIISQLMQLEAQPQVRLKAKVSTEQTALTAYQTINTALKSAVEKARALDSSTDWQVYSATSSATSVAAAAATGARPGTFSFDITALASGQTTLYTTSAAKTATVATGSTIGVSVNEAAAVSIDIGNGSLQAVADGINNKAGLGVKAGFIKMTDGTFRLQLTSTTTGAASKFSLTGLNGALGTGVDTATAADAAIQFGPDAPRDVVTSSSNTFADVFPGVTFTVSKLEGSGEQDGATLTVAGDNTTLASRVKDLVTSLNAALTEISKDTAYNASTKTAGPLLGQLLPSRIESSLRDTILSATGTLATAGIQLTSNGAFKLDETKLADALKADSVSVQSLVTGLAQRVVAAAEPVSSATGDISGVITGRQAMIRNLNDQIDAWDTRLSIRQEALKKQYASLETALGALRTQGDWLTGQINSLSTSS